MSILKGKKILIGISGGIAAYKIPLLVRLLIKQQVEVKVIMTESAKEFVAPLTLATLSQNEVHSELVNQETENSTWNNHVKLAHWADLFIVAPATINTLSSMAHGRCNNLLLAAYFSTHCPIYVAPAMDLEMFQHPSTQSNLESLTSNGINVLPVGDGQLASGLVGKGRMLEVEEIVEHIENDIIGKAPLNNKTVVITAGPTYEPIDPVRFLGNRSSGKMGYALAKEAANLGAKVILISGPCALEMTHSSVQVIPVNTAEEMFKEVQSKFNQTDIFIAAAAVADFKVKEYQNHKIKKENNLNSIELEPTIDVLKTISKQKQHQFVVGFALETINERESALKKLTTKNLDAIILNSLTEVNDVFGGEKNKITYINKKKESTSFGLQLKSEVASNIFKMIINDYEAQN